MSLSVLVADVEEMDARYRKLFPDAQLRFARTLREALDCLASGDCSLVVVGVQFDDSRMFELLLGLKSLPTRAPVACARGSQLLSDLDTVQGIALAAKALGANGFLDLMAHPDTDEGNAAARQILLACMQASVSESAPAPN